MYNFHNNDDLITEMAMVGIASNGLKGPRYAISVDSSETRIGEPYFKFYSGRSRKNKTPFARISFLEPRYIIHYKSSNNHFVLNAPQCRALVNFMKTPRTSRVSGRKLTNWQYAILRYNLENIEMDDWQEEEWVWFTQRWKKMHKREIEGQEAENALPIDLPMPNYLLLR